jgi:small-conductance mechanosensitive channel
MSFFQTPAFFWGMGIVFGVAIAIVVLTEIIDRLKRIDHPMAPVMQLLRNVVLLLLAIFFVQRMVMGLTFISLPVRLVATGMWIFVIVVIMRASSVLFREEDGPTWHDNVPRLFKRLPVLVVVLLIAAYVLQDIWSLPLAQYATALGLGSVAIAFALQDTLSNLVSGLFILFNRPFLEGEWIHIGDTEGRVLSVTWRYTQIETRNGDLIVIPNGSIAQDSIVNHSQPFPRSRVVQPIVVAYANPPNKVTRMLIDTMLATPGILADPAPMVAVTAIDDPLMGYEMRYWIGDYASKPAIHNALMTRIWYAARRYDVALPSPAFDLYHYDAPTVNQESEITPARIVALLNSVETFAMLPEEVIEELATAATFQEFARSESMASAGGVEQGLSVIIQGEGKMTIADADGVDHLVEHLGPGEIFGETGLFGRPVSPYTIEAEIDVELVRIDYAVVNNTINRHPQFAAGINAFIKRRRLTVERLTNEQRPPVMESPVHQTNGRHIAAQGEPQ